MSDHPGKFILDKLVALQKDERAKNGGKCNPYIEVLLDITKLFIQEREDKKHTIVLYGRPNSGKTTFLDKGKAIFDGYDNRQAEGRFGTLIRTR